MTRLLKTSKMNSNRSELSAFPFLPKLNAKLNANPFGKKDAIGGAAAAGAVNANAISGAEDGKKEDADGNQNAEEKSASTEAADATDPDGAKVPCLRGFSFCFVTHPHSPSVCLSRVLGGLVTLHPFPGYGVNLVASHYDIGSGSQLWCKVGSTLVYVVGIRLY